MEPITREQLEEIGLEYSGQDTDEDLRFNDFNIVFTSRLSLEVCLTERLVNGVYECYDLTVEINSTFHPACFDTRIKNIGRLKLLIDVLSS